MSKFEIREINIENLSTLENSWQLCLQNSDANPLFSSWFWQKTWWDIWQPRLNLNLLLLGLYQNGDLIGLAPCYTYKFKNKLNFQATRCEFIGNYSGNDDSIRSEYLDFILPKKKSSVLLPLIFDYLKKSNMDECVLSDMLLESESAQWLRQAYKIQEQHYCKSFQIETETSFTTYLTKLGKNTRLKLFNRRKLLNSVQVLSIENDIAIDEFFGLLNKMHEKRWNKKCFSLHSLSFHKNIADHFNNKGLLRSLVLLEEGKAKAVSYDIEVEGVCYNIQLGFELGKNSKISVGTLMLGYVIENAFNSGTIKEFDLLAGGGKKTSYKEKFKGNTKNLTTIVIPLSNIGKALFLILAPMKFLKSKIKKYLKRAT